MPHVRIKTSAGPVNLNYTISTPTTANAKSIDKALPTVIFLHPAFIAQEIFHCMLTSITLGATRAIHLASPLAAQFVDPGIRRFNLIAVDSRCHGATTGRVSKDYGCVEAAEDIAKFMASVTHGSPSWDLNAPNFDHPGRTPSAPLPRRRPVFGIVHGAPASHIAQEQSDQHVHDIAAP
jgi:pimeloyl-ACP methyl ester carboxylesterase